MEHLGTFLRGEGSHPYPRAPTRAGDTPDPVSAEMQGHLLSVFMQFLAAFQLTTGDLRPPSWRGGSVVTSFCDGLALCAYDGTKALGAHYLLFSHLLLIKPREHALWPYPARIQPLICPIG